MNILQLCPRSIVPPDDGGRISMYNVTRHLSGSGATVTVLCEGSPSPSQQNEDVHGQSVQFYHSAHSTANSFWRIARSLIDPEPLYLRKHFSTRLLGEAGRLLQAKSIDVLHADHTAMAPLALALKKTYGLPVGLRLHNVEWRIWQGYADSLSAADPRRWYVQRQAAKMKSREAQCIAEADVVFPISQSDADIVQSMVPHARIQVAKAGVNADEWREPQANVRDELTLVMAGAWRWIHNVNAARWFINEVFPKVRAAVEKVQLVIPGRDAPNEFALREADGIRALGYQQRIQPVYHRATVFVAPLFVGSGVRIKVLEAMASGLVVVATTVGAEGIEAGEAQGLFRFDSPDDQARCIVELLRDPSRPRALGRQAQDHVAQHYNWSTEIGKIYTAYAELCGRA